jgi:LmbE family N-acetylglucosaminyl deacetylase
MATLVCFHAHPDDEAIATGGIMIRAAAAGHRVVLVCATRGELGEPEEGVLREGEPLWERRMAELAEAARILGAEAPLWLGYEDSGMEGEPSNENPASFWQADHDEATARLAAILVEVEADVLTIYDSHGGYGHPDHVRVHTVGVAAAASAGLIHVFESTINRTDVAEMMQAEDAAARIAAGDLEVPEIDIDSFGTAFEEIHYRIDVSSVIEVKRAAIVAHRSQIGPDSWFLSIEDDEFIRAFGSEWFNVPGEGARGGPIDVDLLPGLDP